MGHDRRLAGAAGLDMFVVGLLVAISLQMCAPAFGDGTATSFVVDATSV